MGKSSKIEWTDHTFNPWWGCQKVSDGCKFCYAEIFDKRIGGSHWGPDSERREMSDKYWRQPIRWNEDAGKIGVKTRVFCASMADVFEDNPKVVKWRDRLFSLIRTTPNIIWQILTKRPENIKRFAPVIWVTTGFPSNVWIGTTVENQEMAKERIPHLMKIPARVRFLSCEPLLGPLDITQRAVDYSVPTKLVMGQPAEWTDPGPDFIGIDWVITGGESGHSSRPPHPDWFINLRDQCIKSGVPFFFKQWGEWQEGSNVINHHYSGKHIVMLNNGEYTDYLDNEKYKQFSRERGSQWNELNATVMAKVGKNNSGSLLDGKEYKNFPKYG